MFNIIGWRNIEPVFGGFASSFSYDFKPNSLTILRIKKK